MTTTAVPASADPAELVELALTAAANACWDVRRDAAAHLARDTAVDILAAILRSDSTHASVLLNDRMAEIDAAWRNR